MQRCIRQSLNTAARPLLSGDERNTDAHAPSDAHLHFNEVVPRPQLAAASKTTPAHAVLDGTHQLHTHPFPRPPKTPPGYRPFLQPPSSHLGDPLIIHKVSGFPGSPTVPTNPVTQYAPHGSVIWRLPALGMPCRCRGHTSRSRRLTVGSELHKFRGVVEESIIRETPLSLQAIYTSYPGPGMAWPLRRWHSNCPGS